jgi:hypothetical protein
LSRRVLHSSFGCSIQATAALHRRVKL